MEMTLRVELKDIEGRPSDVTTMAPANQVMLQLLARYMYSNQVEVYAQVSARANGVLVLPLPLPCHLFIAFLLSTLVISYPAARHCRPIWRRCSTWKVTPVQAAPPKPTLPFGCKGKL